MAGNARFELPLGSHEPGVVGNYPNGPRGSYAGSSLGRSGSFRDGGENQMCSSGAGVARVSGMLTGNLPPLSQCLMLEPIIIGDHKYTRTGELRRALGFSVGSASEENTFGAAHSRTSSLVAIEELKRYKESIDDANKKARGRVRKFDVHLHKLNKYFEVVNTKKQKRNEQSTNERSGGLNLKMGTQIHRNPADLVTQRHEDWARNVVPNKRVRTSLAETRAECRSNGLARQPLVMTKDRDMPKDSTGPDLVEEKIRRLPTGGEGWDKKMKRKRSFGTTVMRPVDNGELKRSTHHKDCTESGLQSCDTDGFRSGTSNAISGTSKLDDGSFPGSSVSRTVPKIEQEKATLTRDLTAGSSREKLLAKGNNKLNVHDDNHTVSPSPVTKRKASRAPRSGSVTAANSSLNISRVSGASENWEQPPSARKIQSVDGADHRKRAMPSGSSSPPMAQWVGQRPQKISRTRRSNLVSPVSDHEERQISSEGCSPSDFNARINSSGMNDTHPFRGMVNGTQQFKVKLEHVPSPARFSESEESGAGENKLKEKVTVSGEVEEKIGSAALNTDPSSIILAKNNKAIVKIEMGDGVRRQGRSGRGSSFSKASISPVREKLENTATTKPLRRTGPGSDKHKSKTGRPLKKLLDRKGLSRRGNMLHTGSPDFTGDSDDDREELVTAANLACNASYRACSSSFWKKMEPIFAPVSLQDTTYFLQQGAHVQEEISGCETFGSGGIDMILEDQIESKDSAGMVEFVDQFRLFDSLCGRLESEVRFNKVTPLYQRVLSALIIEDEIEEVEENVERNVSRQYAANDLCYDTEPKKTCRMEFDCDSTFGAQTWKQCAGNRFCSCNGSDTSDRNTYIQNSPQDELLRGESGFVYSEVGVSAGISSNDLDGPQIVQANGCSRPSFDRQYDKMCIEDKLLLELQSIGLYIEAVPDLDDRDDEMTNQEIDQLKKVLHQQVCRKKPFVNEVYKSFQHGQEKARELEQVAMDRLVELAYKKISATRGSVASKYGIPKVPKQVALAFAKRTIARCQAFEDSGTCCFNEPALRDIFFAAAPRDNEAEPSTGDDLGLGSLDHIAERHDPHRVSSDAFENFAHQSDKAFAKSGPISNRWKKKEVLLDDVGGNSAFRHPSTLGSMLLGGVKGKRSEREGDKNMSTRNTVAKAGPPVLSNCRGERKTKTKPKQKTAQLSTSGNGYVDKSSARTHPVYPSTNSSGDLVTNASNKKRDVQLMSPGAIPQDSFKETKESMKFPTLQLPEIDSIDELGVSTDLGGDPDSWFNFDEDGLQDGDLDGLAVPMDDIALLF